MPKHKQYQGGCNLRNLPCNRCCNHPYVGSITDQTSVFHACVMCCCAYTPTCMQQIIWTNIHSNPWQTYYAAEFWIQPDCLVAFHPPSPNPPTRIPPHTHTIQMYCKPTRVASLHLHPHTTSSFLLLEHKYPWMIHNSICCSIFLISSYCSMMLTLYGLTPSTCNLLSPHVGLINALISSEKAASHRSSVAIGRPFTIIVSIVSIWHLTLWQCTFKCMQVMLHQGWCQKHNHTHSYHGFVPVFQTSAPQMLWKLL